jgi:hypothetical protein
MSAHVLLSLAVNSKSERKVASLPTLGFEPATFGTQTHLSDRSAHLVCCHCHCCCFYLKKKKKEKKEE